MTVVEWCVSGVKDLRFIGREFHKRGEELRNDRSTNLSLVETGGRERHRLPALWQSLHKDSNLRNETL